MAEKTKEQRIRKEKNRLNRIFKNIEKSKKDVADGLINRAAFMRVELEDLEEKLLEEGWIEMFQQSNKVPAYERQRPAGQTYISVNNSYQKIIKSLIDIVPDDSAEDAAAELLNFVNKR